MVELGDVLRQIVREEICNAIQASAPGGTVRYEDADAVAGRTGIKKSTLKQYRLNGEGPPFSRIGRRVVYAPADVDAWIRANRIG